MRGCDGKGNKDEVSSQCPHDIRIATHWYKPGKNQTDQASDFYIHETDQWLVFPHELNGVAVQEILNNKPDTDNKFLDHPDYTK